MIFNAGNTNYQQENGYYEINPIFGRHPSKQRIYATKTIECIAVYGITKAVPKYEKATLIVANTIVWGMIYTDYNNGIALSVRW